MTYDDESVGKTHTARLLDLKGKILAGEYPRGEVVNETVEILARIFQCMDRSERDYGYQDRGGIIQGDDERDQT